MQAALLSMEATPEGIFLLPPNGKRLLVRSLSDGAKYGSSIRKRLAAQQTANGNELYSMSESCLKESDFDVSDSSSTSSSCSCGCGDVPSLNEVEVDSSDDEDEGFAKDDYDEEVVGPKSVVYVDSAERRSFSSSVDSGRSSDRDGSLNKSYNTNKISVFVPYCEDLRHRESSSNNKTNITISSSQIQIKCSSEKEIPSLVPPDPSTFSLQQSITHRRKDLCKLLGLSEDTASSKQRFKEVQKLAIKHLNAHSNSSNQSTPRKKKNLAKFLGVTENSDMDEPIPFEEFKLRVQEKRRRDSPSRSSFIRNLFKTSSINSLNRNGSIGSSGREPLDYTLLQQDGKNRKDLTKFLGLNDSDSEEIIFIQNKKRNGLRKSSSWSSLNSSSYCSHRRTRRLKTPEIMRKSILQKRNGVSPLPCRKSVLFKEYDFSVEESIAKGQPIIPPNGERKKKKDAYRRSVEVSQRMSLEELLRDVSICEKLGKRRVKRRAMNQTPFMSYDPKGRIRIVPKNPPQYLFQFIRKSPCIKDFTHIQRTIAKR
ncbi:uncharacterized protein [Lepeophtheirus salmonis]|uniref:uncharacterized protein n=1 Tax=Lepeophtheirus salmonis TaxID=72036 RepID=UPI001AE5D50D|nr:uncharacterized protein LOC121127935 [Lepeophtheirus salmonis]